jgi:hypothetical protein
MTANNIPNAFSDYRRPLGMELFDIRPVMLGGDPADLKNKAWLTREQHIEAVRYWNRVIQLQKNQVK